MRRLFLSARLLFTVLIMDVQTVGLIVTSMNLLFHMFVDFFSDSLIFFTVN